MDELDFDPDIPYSKTELWKRIRLQESENTQLNKSLQTAKSNATSLLQSNSNLEIEVNQHMEEKAELQQQVNELLHAQQNGLSRVDVLHNDSRQLFEETERLRRENEQHIKAISELRQDNSRIAGEVIRLRTESNQKSSDEYFVKAWDDLKYSISNWAFKHFQGHLVLPKDFKANWEIASLVDDVASYLRSEKRRWLLVQSFVWRSLEDKVLHRTAVLWAGQHRHALRQLIEAVEQESDHAPSSAANDLVAFHRWKALNAALLPSVADQRAVQEAAEKGVVEPILKVLLPHALTANAAHDRTCREELLEIVLKAIALSEEFDQQRAQFKVYRPAGPRGEEFDVWCDSKTLQSENGSSQDGNEVFVKLVMIPGLHRYGDLDGTGKYDDGVVIAKAEVECDKSRAKKSDGNLRRAPTRLRRHGQQRQQVDASKDSANQEGGQEGPKRRPIQVIEQNLPLRKSFGVRDGERTKTIPRKSVQDRSQERPRDEARKNEKPLPPSPKVEQPATGGVGPGLLNSPNSNKSNKSFGDRAKKLLSPRRLMIDEERHKWQRKQGGAWPDG